MNLTMIYKYLSIASFILTGIFLILAVVLFYKWKIPKIFGDLTGRSEKKRIAEIKERGIESVASENYRAGVKRIYQTKGKTSSQELKTGKTGKTGKTAKSKELSGKIFGENLVAKIANKPKENSASNVTIPLEQYEKECKEEMNASIHTTVENKPVSSSQKKYQKTVLLKDYEEANQMSVSEKSIVAEKEDVFTSLLFEEESKGNDYKETGLLGITEEQSSNLCSPASKEEMKLVFAFESTGTDKVIGQM